MPKIIENLENRLMEEARRQVSQSGYAAMTIRSVAKSCGVGVGTVYNYFPSKDALLASYMLKDWTKCVAAIEAVSAGTDAARDVVQSICDQLVDYCALHRTVIRDPDAASGFSGSFSRYHGVLRSQLSAPLRKFCQDDFTAEFIAESLLTWTMAGKSMEEIYSIIEKLF